MRMFQHLKRFGLIACLLLLGSCGYQDSPAPGCVKDGLSASSGGCFGKTAIIDLALVSTPGCLVIEANNCNGGVLEIRNNCAENTHLGEILILPSSSAILDVRESEETVVVFETDTNFSEYKPDARRQIVITGTVGSQPIQIAYTRTEPLCE
jgi:hypothetical protein